MAGLRLNRDECRHTAAAIGTATGQVAAHLLEDPAVDRLRTVGCLLRLREHYGDDRLEAACQRAIQFGEPTYVTVKRILQEDLDVQPPLAPVVAPTHAARPAYTFVRTPWELLGHLFRGATWS